MKEVTLAIIMNDLCDGLELLLSVERYYYLTFRLL